MTIVRWDPFKDLETFKDRMDQLFEDTLAKPRRHEGLFSHPAWSPPVDIYETDSEIVLKAEVPGMNKDEISVEVKDNTLSIKGERRFEKEVTKENCHRVERQFGSFQRSFLLPSSVQPDKVKAKLKDGILELSIPKSEESKPKQIKVEVK